MYNKPIYVIYAVYRKINPKMDTTMFCSLLGIDKETFVTNLEKDWKSGQFHKINSIYFFIKSKSRTIPLFSKNICISSQDFIQRSVASEDIHTPMLHTF
ncbi:MAG: hypothetical protein IPJ39_22320 [Saprospiraceae bacterium]|nr:hypothetical protein [Saprospiraceae bacterium]